MLRTWSSTVVCCVPFEGPFPLPQARRVVVRVRHGVPVVVGLAVCVDGTEEVRRDVDHSGGLSVKQRNWWDFCRGRSVRRQSGERCKRGYAARCPENSQDIVLQKRRRWVRQCKKECNDRNSENLTELGCCWRIDLARQHHHAKPWKTR